MLLRILTLTTPRLATHLTRNVSNSSRTTMSWHANFPAPKATPPQMTVQELADLQGTPGVDYIVVDARRTDIVGVRGGLQCCDERAH